MSDHVLVVVNWGTFQHYRKRNPPWIKMHTSLLDDYDFHRLPGNAKWQLPLLWLIAARQDNRIPDDREWLAELFHVGQDNLEIDLLIASGWLERRIAPGASSEPLAPNASASAEHPPLDPGACVSTTAVQLQAETETDARARDPHKKPEFAEQF